MLVFALLGLLAAGLLTLLARAVWAVRSPRALLVMAGLALGLGVGVACVTLWISPGSVHVSRLHPELPVGHWSPAYVRAAGFPVAQWATDDPFWVRGLVAEPRTAILWDGLRFNVLFYAVPAFLLLAEAWQERRARTSRERSPAA